MLNQHVAMCAALSVAWSASAAVPLFSNGSANPANHGLATGASAANGVPAPAGAQWSELQASSAGVNALAGASVHASGTPGTFRVADDFVVTGAAPGWMISSVTLFAYLSSGSATFTALDLRVWNGMPGSAGSAIVWQSAGRGATLAASPIPLYRIFNSVAVPLSAPTSVRQVWTLRLTTPGLTLAPGRYWIDWQTTLSNSFASAASPLVTAHGTRGPAGANAIQLKPRAGTPQWSNIIDPGKPASSADVNQEIPFLIEGVAASPPCPGDVNGSGAVNFADISDVLTFWGWSYTPATGKGDTDRNGVVEFADITQVLLNWGIPCP